MEYEVHVKRWCELTVDELHDIIQARLEVFVVEQNCVYQDLDGDDPASVHVWLTVEGRVVAVCRVCPAGTHLSQVSIGRVITRPHGRGYGLPLMRRAIEVAQEAFGATQIDIEAQEYARGFYERVGFVGVSDTFMLDRIPHIRMTWRK